VCVYDDVCVCADISLKKEWRWPASSLAGRTE
jgi:hypothetical protein